MASGRLGRGHGRNVSGKQVSQTGAVVLEALTKPPSRCLLRVEPWGC